MFLKYGFLFRGLGIYLLDYMGYVDRRITLETIRRKKCLYLKRKYRKLVANFPREHSTSYEYEKIIWVCWFQGLESAPPLVKKCIDSIKKNAGDNKVILITSENINEYAHIPEILIEKWKKKIINNTHFSDILRCQLLIEHGGFWIDSTCLLTGQIPEFLYKNKKFSTIRNENRFEETTKLSSWFMFSCKGNNVLQLVMKLEETYWKKHNKLEDYFLFHLFFNISLSLDPEMWDSVPKIFDLGPHSLSYSLLDDFDSELFKYYLQESFIHKLTYKFDCEPKKKSFYDYLLTDFN